MSRGQQDKGAKLAAAYEEAVGHPPRNLDADHPDHWQWVYRGTKEERQKALEMLGLVADDEQPVLIDGQMELG